MDTVQQGLNELVKNKLEARISRGESNAKSAISRLIEEGKVSRDFLVNIGSENAGVAYERRTEGYGEDAPVNYPVSAFVYNRETGGDYFSLNQNAVGQLAEKFQIPTSYLRKLAGGKPWERELAVQVLNEHSQHAKQNRVLFRAVGDEVMGVLSDSYRRLNAQIILTSFIETAYQQGALLADGMMDDTRVYIELLMPQPLIIPTTRNGDVAMAFGARLSTSDYGDGALDLRTFMMQGICLNGMVRESVMRQVHIGSVLPENILLSAETYDSDTRTSMLAVRDITKALFSKESLEKRAFEIQKASATEVNIATELRNLNKNGLLLSDCKAVEEILINNNPEDGVEGGNSLWRLVAGVTAHGRNIGAEGDVRRERDLQEIAGNLLNRIKLETV